MSARPITVELAADAAIVLLAAMPVIMVCPWNIAAICAAVGNGEEFSAKAIKKTIEGD